MLNASSFRTCDNDGEMIRIRTSVSFCLLAVVAFGGNRGARGLVRVHGRGRFGGEARPAPGSMSFMPVEVASGFTERTATGKVADDGTFVVNSFKDDDGLAPGKYDISISCYTGLP